MEKKEKRGLPARKKITIAEIARHCDVSTSTVSRILSGRTNIFPFSEAMIQRVHEAAKQLDYRPDWVARAISNQCTHLIGLSCLDIDTDTLGRFSNAILSHPGFKDYDLVLLNRNETENQPLRPSDFKSDLLDGMVYLDPSDDHPAVLNVASEDFPIVLLGRLTGAEEKMPCLDINNRKMAQLAVEHLIGLGRRNILMLIPEELQHLSCMRDRLQGYRNALTENGIQISDELICTVTTLRDHVDVFLRDFPRRAEVDAIFCATDLLADFCAHFLKAIGHRIPEDIALIGFGNALDNLPTISSVNLPVQKMAHVTIDLLLKILKKEVPYEPGFHEVETELVIRESTAGTKKI